MSHTSSTPRAQALKLNKHTRSSSTSMHSRGAPAFWAATRSIDPHHANARDYSFLRISRGRHFQNESADGADSAELLRTHGWRARVLHSVSAAGTEPAGALSGQLASNPPNLRALAGAGSSACVRVCPSPAKAFSESVRVAIQRRTLAQLTLTDCTPGRRLCDLAL